MPELRHRASNIRPVVCRNRREPVYIPLVSDQAPHGDRRARLDEALGLILRVSGQESFAPDANLDGRNWPELIVLAAREATDPTHGRGVGELTAAIAVVLGVPLDELLTIDQMIEVAAPAAPPPLDPTVTPDISAERAAEDIEQVREGRWRACGSERAELGLIAELLGIDTSGSDAGRPLYGPAIDPGEVLAAARAALSAPAQTISPFFTEEMLERATAGGVTDEMVSRALAKGVGGDLDGLGASFVEEFLRPAVRGVLEDILGVEPSSPLDREVPIVPAEGCSECHAPPGGGHTGYCSKSAMRGGVRGARPLSVEFDTYERDRFQYRGRDCALGDIPVGELSARRQEIIQMMRGPDLPVEEAARLSHERELLEVELERRTRPEPYDQLGGWRNRALEAETRAARYAGRLARVSGRIEVLLGVLDGHGALTGSIEDVDIPAEWPSVGCENIGHEQSPVQHGVEGWRCPDCGSTWWATNGAPQPKGHHIVAFLFRLVADLRLGLTAQTRRITINGLDFAVKGGAMCGADLYRTPTPPLDPDYHELFQDTPGPGPGTWISPAQLVDFDQGETFHSTPRRAT